MIFWLVIAYIAVGFFVARHVAVKLYEDDPDVFLAILPAIGAGLLWPLYFIGWLFWVKGVMPVLDKRGSL